MKNISSAISLPSSDVCMSGSTLANWLVAITDFHTCYHQLSNYISQKLTEQNLLVVPSPPVSRCSLAQLTKLAISMEKELTNLAQDIDQSTEFKYSAATEGYGKLVAHTQALNHLSKQARRALLLINCAAG